MERTDNSTSQNQTSDGSHFSLLIGSKRAYIGGLLAMGVAFAGQWIIGQIYSGFEARKLLEATSESARYLGSSLVTASATILALMLTLIGLVKQADKNFDQEFFKKIETIGWLATIELIGATLLLLFLSLPVQESDQVPGTWFTWLYYFTIIFIAVLSGLLVTIVLMLLNSITSTIHAVRPSAKNKKTDEKPSENP